MQLGDLRIDSPVALAPMAGITDKPYRQLCRQWGAGYAVSEMLSANPALWSTVKSRRRRDHCGERTPVIVQIAGSDPSQLAAAAQFSVDQGAQVIDINMGCPAKKVCRALAGSALLRDERLVGRILEAVVDAVDVPVTVKIRTGYSNELVNGVRIAQIAESSGVSALTVHGRTREQRFTGVAEYQTIAAIKRAVSVPVVANGDIDTPIKAQAVLEETRADALMIGRAARGRPWFFRQIAWFLETGEQLAEPSLTAIASTVAEHIAKLHDFYGPVSGVRVARKHLAWYAAGRAGAEAFRNRINRIESADRQLVAAREFFESLQMAEGVDSEGGLPRVA